MFKANTRSQCVQSFIVLLKVYACSSIVAVLTILAITNDWETTAAASLAPVFLLPSMVLFIIFGQVSPTRMWKHLGYLMPALGILSYCMIGVIMDLLGQMTEGSGLPIIMAFTFGVPALTTYLLLLRMNRRVAQPDTPADADEPRP